MWHNWDFTLFSGTLVVRFRNVCSYVIGPTWTTSYSWLTKNGRYCNNCTVVYRAKRTYVIIQIAIFAENEQDQILSS